MSLNFEDYYCQLMLSTELYRQTNYYRFIVGKICTPEKGNDRIEHHYIFYIYSNKILENYPPMARIIRIGNHPIVRVIAVVQSFFKETVCGGQSCISLGVTTPNGHICTAVRE